MGYILECDTCGLDRPYADWVEANRAAADHEGTHPDHWVTIVARQPA